MIIIITTFITVYRCIVPMIIVTVIREVYTLYGKCYINIASVALCLFIHSFILETYIAPLQETTTQRCSQPSHGQRRRTSEICKILKGGPSKGTAAQREDHSMLMDPHPKSPFFILVGLLKLCLHCSQIFLQP